MRKRGKEFVLLFAISLFIIGSFGCSFKKKGKADKDYLSFPGEWRNDEIYLYIGEVSYGYLLMNEQKINFIPLKGEGYDFTFRFDSPSSAQNKYWKGKARYIYRRARDSSQDILLFYIQEDSFSNRSLERICLVAGSELNNRCELV